MVMNARVHVKQQVDKILMENCSVDHLAPIIAESETKEQATERVTKEVWKKVKPILESEEFKTAFGKKSNRSSQKSDSLDRAKKGFESDILDRIEERVEREWNEAIELKKLNEERAKKGKRIVSKS